MSRPPHGARGREQRAVAAQHDQQIARRRALRRAAKPAQRSRVAPRSPDPGGCRHAALRRSQRDQLRHDARRFRLAARLRDDSGGSNGGHKAGIPDCLPRPGSGLSMIEFPHGCEPPALRPRAARDRRRRGAAPDRARCLLCRPDRGRLRTAASPGSIISPSLGRASGAMAGISRVAEMKLASHTARSNLLGKIAGLKIARVHAFADDHARIVAQFPVELAVADVDRLDSRRAALQQAIGESAGGRAHVQADAPAHVDLEMIQRRGQLEPAAARRRACARRLRRGSRSGTAWPGLSRLLAVDQQPARPGSAPAPFRANRPGRARPGVDRATAVVHGAVMRCGGRSGPPAAQPLARDRRSGCKARCAASRSSSAISRERSSP